MRENEISSSGSIGDEGRSLEKEVNLQRERADVIAATPIREAIGTENLKKLNEEFGAGNILRVTAALARDDIISEEDSPIWNGVASAIEGIGQYGK